MQTKTSRLLTFGGMLVCGLLPVVAQDAAVLQDRLWSPTPRMELADPLSASDQLWIDHTTLLGGNSPAEAHSGFNAQYNFGNPSPTQLSRSLLVTPDEIVLMGREADEAFHRAGQLMEEPIPAHDPVDGWEVSWRDLSRLGSLQSAAKLIWAIKKSFPDWHPGLVARRATEIEQRIEKHKKETRQRNKFEPGTDGGRDQPLMQIADGAAPKPDDTAKTNLELGLNVQTDDHNEPGIRYPDEHRPEKRLKQKEPPEHEKGDRKEHPEALPDAGKLEHDALRRRLRETGQALRAAQRREAALKAVLRDLLNETEAPAQAGRGHRRPTPSARPIQDFDPLQPGVPVLPAAPLPPPAPTR